MREAVNRGATFRATEAISPVGRLKLITRRSNSKERAGAVRTAPSLLTIALRATRYRETRGNRNAGKDERKKERKRRGNGRSPSSSRFPYALTVCGRQLVLEKEGERKRER